MRNGPVAAVAGGWIVLLTVAVDPSGWYPFGPAKWAVASIGVLTLTALTMRARSITVVPRVQILMWALVAVFAVAAAVGVDPRYAWVGTPERHLGVLTWVLLALALGVGLNIGRPTQLLWGASLAGLALGTASTLEALGWEPRVFDVDDRLSATYGSPAYLGAAVALLLPICVACALDGSLGSRLRVIAAIAAPLLTVAAFGSGARAAWVGLLVGGLAVGARRRRSAWRALRARRASEVLVAAVAAACLVAGVIVLSPVGPRLAATLDTDVGGGRSRIDEWRVAAAVARDHPAFGVGPEGYRIAFAEGVDAKYERAFGRDPAPDRAHAAPLDVLVAGGLGALVLWAALLMVVGRHAWRTLADERCWVAGLATALVAYFAGQMLLFPLAEIDPVAWLIAGVVVSASAEPREVRTWWPWRGSVLVPAAFAVLALVAGVTDITADHRARAAVDARARGDLEAALVEAERATALRPDIVRLHLLEAQVAIDAGRGAVVALRAVDEARDVSPRDPIVNLRMLELLVDRAQATSVAQHAAEARAAVALAVRDDPYNAQLRVLEGRAARLDGDDDAAERAWRLAEDLAPRSPVPAADLALLYLDQGRLDEARLAIARASAIDSDDAFVVSVRARVDATR